MSEKSQEILDKALDLPPLDRADLLEKLFESFDMRHRKRLDALWAAEAEARIDGFENGELDALPARAVFDKIDRGCR